MVKNEGQTKLNLFLNDEANIQLASSLLLLLGNKYLKLHLQSY